MSYCKSLLMLFTIKTKTHLSNKALLPIVGVVTAPGIKNARIKKYVIASEAWQSPRVYTCEEIASSFLLAMTYGEYVMIMG